MRRFVFVCVVLLSLPAAVVGASSSSSWPQVGGTPGLTRSNDAERTLAPGTAASLTEVWRLTEGDGARVAAPPVASGGVVFAVSSGETDSMVAVRISDGQLLWRAPLGADTYAMPAVAGRLVLASTINSELVAVDRTTGALRWRAHFDAPEAGNCAPTVAGNDIFASSGTAVARIASSGKILWRRPTPACEPAADGTALYLGAGRKLVKLDRASGRRLFAVSLPKPAAALAVASGRVYLTLALSRNDQLQYTIQARTARNGALVWSKQLAISKWIGSQMLAVEHGVVYAVAMDGRLVALDGRSGRVRWTAPLEPTASSPAVANGVVYVLDGNGDLLALAASNGTRLWSAHVGALIPIYPTAPAIADGTLLIGSDDGMRAFRSG